MAINLNKGKKKPPKAPDIADPKSTENASAAPEQPQGHDQNESQDSGNDGFDSFEVSTPAPQQRQPAQPRRAGSALAFGSRQQQSVERIEAQSELRNRLNSGAREFFLAPGSFARLFFLDGVLVDTGVFDTPMVATHLLQIGERWHNIVCPQPVEGDCVVCNEGKTPTTLQLFTVINFTPYTIQKGPNRGKVIDARLQLLAIPPSQRSRLVRKAETHKGLKGKAFQFSRTTNTAPRTGDDIELIGERSIDAALKKWPKLGGSMEKPEPTAVIDYETAYPLLTNEEIGRLLPMYRTGGYGTSGGGSDTFAGGSAPEPNADGIPF